MKLVLCSVLLLALISLTFAQDLCPATIGQTSYPSLPNLRATADYLAQDTAGNNYQWNFCGLSVSYPSCAGIANSCSCQNGAGASPKSCGTTGNQVLTAVVSSNINSVNFFWAGGSTSGSCTNARSTNITITCLKNAPTTVVGLVTESNVIPVGATASCLYNIAMQSGAVCPKTSSGGSSGVKPPKKGGLSGGSIFLIIISCLAFVYVAGGMIFNWQKYDASGWELCPNREFWSGFGGLIKGGALFTWSKITGSTPSTSYESVE